MTEKQRVKTISVPQLYKMFPTEQSCFEWLEEVRWKDKPVCPHCGRTGEFTKPKSKPYTYWHGLDCRKQFRVTTGTCMHATKQPLQDWIYAIYSLMTARKGVSALQISKELGCNYRTAWHMLHRIREGFVHESVKLSNIVESDTTYVGGKESNKHESKKLKQGRGTVGKTPVVGIKEREGKVKAKPVECEDAKTLIDFVNESITDDTTVYTDEATVYARLAQILRGITHETVKHGQGEYKRGTVHTKTLRVYGLFSSVLSMAPGTMFPRSI